MVRYLVALAAALSLGACAEPEAPPQAPVVPEVDPFIGTGGLGFGVGSIPPGPTRPYGLAKPGPATATLGRAPAFSHCAGYWWEDDQILSFAQIHLAGTGVPDYGVVRIMPAVDLPEDVVGPSSYRSTLDHRAEQGAVGKYRVRLSPSGIDVHVGATQRTSIYRMRYPEGHTNQLVVDLSRGIAQGRTEAAELEWDGTSLSGWMHHVGMLSGGFDGWRVNFVMRFSETPTVKWLVKDRVEAMDGTNTSSSAGAVLTFAGAEVGVQIGLSFVDVDAARVNLETEWVDFDLDRAQRETEAEWETLLQRVRVVGGEPSTREMFYTALYHAHFMPTAFTDSDGRYRGIDGEIHRADGFTYYTDFSLWDTFRTLHPLLTLLYPELQRDMNTSLMAMTEQSGRIPKWPLATGESNTMISYHAESVVADAYTKGVGGFDAEVMYGYLERAAMAAQDSLRKRDCSRSYLERGWCAADEESRSTSKTLENAFGDFVVARFAESIGKDASVIDARSKNWRHVFDESVGLVRGRYADGTFVPEFEGGKFSEDFVEGNARQWTVFVPHDAAGLAEAMGGEDRLVAFLEEFFESAASADETVLPDLWYWHGNEPDIHAAYVFAEVGRPDLTQKWVDWVRSRRYTDGPDGLDGNDDGGTLSAWYVFSALGFFPKIGEARYVLGTPLFPEVSVQLPEDRTLRIVAKNWRPGAYAVDRVTFDGIEIDGPWIDHATLAAGGELVFEMTP